MKAGLEAMLWTRPRLSHALAASLVDYLAGLLSKFNLGAGGRIPNEGRKGNKVACDMLGFRGTAPQFHLNLKGKARCEGGKVEIEEFLGK